MELKSTLHVNKLEMKFLQNRKIILESIAER